MRALLAWTILLLATSGALAVDPDPAPVLDEFPAADDGRHYVGIFDFVRSRRAAPSCANGNCPTDSGAVVAADVPKPAFAAPAPVTKTAPTPAQTPTATSTPASATSTPLASAFRARRFRPVANLLESVVTWYPGRAFARLRGCD